MDKQLMDIAERIAVEIRTTGRDHRLYYLSDTIYELLQRGVIVAGPGLREEA